MSRVQEIKKEISKLKRELSLIQSECNHPKSCRVLLQKHDSCKINYDTQEYELQGIVYHWRCGLCENEWAETVREE